MAITINDQAYFLYTYTYIYRNNVYASNPIKFHGESVVDSILPHCPRPGSITLKAINLQS